jgi:hypothetical protein
MYRHADVAAAALQSIAPAFYDTLLTHVADLPFVDPGVAPLPEDATEHERYLHGVSPVLEGLARPSSEIPSFFKWEYVGQRGGFCHVIHEQHTVDISQDPCTPEVVEDGVIHATYNFGRDYSEAFPPDLRHIFHYGVDIAVWLRRPLDSAKPLTAGMEMPKIWRSVSRVVPDGPPLRQESPLMDYLGSPDFAGPRGADPIQTYVADVRRFADDLLRPYKHPHRSNYVEMVNQKLDRTSGWRRADQARREAARAAKMPLRRSGLGGAPITLTWPSGGADTSAAKAQSPERARRPGDLGGPPTAHR